MGVAASMGEVLGEFLEVKTERGELTGQSVEKYRRVLGRFDRHLRREGLRLVPGLREQLWGRDEVEEWLWRMNHGHPSWNTWRMCVQVLASFCAWGLGRRPPLWERDPLPERPRHPRAGRQREATPVRPQQIQDMLDAVRNVREEDPRISRGTAWRDVVVILLVNLTALRISEVAGLRMEHVFSPEGEVLSRISVFGKGSRWREVPVPPQLRGALEEYLRRERSGRSGPWLFPGKRPGRHLGVRHMRHCYSRVALRAGAPRRPHDGRHGACTAIVEQRAAEAEARGQDPEAAAWGALPGVARLAGHSREDTTKRYVHHLAAPVERAIEEAHAGLRLPSTEEVE